MKMFTRQLVIGVVKSAGNTPRLTAAGLQDPGLQNLNTGLQDPGLARLQVTGPQNLVTVQRRFYGSSASFQQPDYTFRQVWYCFISVD